VSMAELTRSLNHVCTPKWKKKAENTVMMMAGAAAKILKV